MVEFRFADNPVCEAHGSKEHLALHPRGFVVDEKLKAVAWYTMTRERAFDVARVLIDMKDILVFVDVRGRKYILRPLTLNRYRRKIMPRLEGAPDFESQEEMEKFFAEHRRSK